jgi:hypothetical protein
VGVVARLRLYLAAGALAALAAGAAWLDHRAYWRGWDDHAAEVAAETREVQRRLHEAADRASRLAAELAAERAAQDDLAQELRDAAADDPRGDDPGLPDSSLRRLDRIR